MKKSATLILQDKENDIASLSKAFLTPPGSGPALATCLNCVIREEDQVPFKAFVKQLPTSIGIFDTEMRYVVVSDTLRRAANLPKHDLTGICHYDILPDLPQKWKDIHQKGLKGERLACEEDSYRRADGSIEWWRWEVLPWYKSEGVIGGIILFVEEITERKVMEKQMKRMIKTLNQSNEDLEKFAHVCAHDLNEPLRTIGNYCHIIQKDFADKLPEAGKEHLGRITKSVKQMSELINGILTYSQVGEGNLKKEKCSIQEVVSAIQWMLEKRIKDKNAIICAEGLPEVYADRVLLTCVFQNLISNSLKFNHKNPTIHIKAKETKNSWMFSVEDNGIGIDPSHFKIIFDLFKRLHSRTAYEGTGIGLAFCKKIIQAHGGKIFVKSALDKGSCFSFTIPKMPIQCQESGIKKKELK